MLADAGDMAVYEATSAQIPHLLHEIGRLREITYRPTGEGTGKSIDLDRFDAWYSHLFVWNKTAGEIVGAYRLGATDDIVRAHGTAGLYTSTLFKYRATLLDRLGPAVELGRSFIRAEYQRTFAPLLLLWKGIGRYVVNHPQCKMLFGPVSISNIYQTASKTTDGPFPFRQSRRCRPGPARPPAPPLPHRRLRRALRRRPSRPPAQRQRRGRRCRRRA